MKNFVKKVLSIIICVCMIIPTMLPATISAQAGTTEKIASGVISYGIKKIPYIGSLAETISMPYINKALGIKPGMSIEDLSKQIDNLNVKIDNNQQQLLSKMYEDSNTKFNDLITDVQTSTSQAYSQIAQIVEHYEGGKTGELDKREEMLEQLEIANIATSKFYSTTGLLEKIVRAEAYISGRNYRATDNALMVIYKTYCNDAVFGGEAGLLAKDSIDAIAMCMEDAYFAADVILQANLYVYNNISDYKNYKNNGDEDFEIFEKNDFRDKNATEGLLKTLISGYTVLFGDANVGKELDENNAVIEGGAFGEYNEMLNKVHFYYIDKCDYTSSTAEVSFIPLSQDISFALASQGGYDSNAHRSKNDNEYGKYKSSSYNLANTFTPVSEGNLSKESLSKIYTHISNNKMFGTKNNNASLQKALENYGFSFENYNKYAKDNNVASNLKRIFASRISRSSSDTTVSAQVCIYGANLDEAVYDAANNVEKKTTLFHYLKEAYKTYSHNYKTCGYDDVAIFGFHEVYEIDSKDDFIDFVKSVSTGDNKSGQEFVLTTDIDLEDFDYSYAWLDRDYKNEFRGILNGDGHTIKNFSFTDSKEHRVALLRTTGEGAVIKNLNFENVNIGGSANKNGYAAVIGYANGNTIIDNVIINSGNIAGYKYVAGMIGESNRGKKMTITNCINNATITSTDTDAAGMIANSGEIYISNCINNGEVTAGKGAAGGISGYLGNRDKDPYFYVENCKNTANITGDDCTAGICANLESDKLDSKIIGNENTGDIKNISKRSAGGIVGRTCAGGLFKDNKNSGNVENLATSNGEAGGILGYNQDDYIKIENNSNSGNITAVTSTGGIAGWLGDRDHDKQCDIIGNSNSGKINSSSSDAGGIVGAISTDNKNHQVSNNSNTGYISAERQAGGIVGYMAGGGLFESNKNRSNVTSNSQNAGGIVGSIQDDLCEFKKSDVDATAVVGNQRMIDDYNYLIKAKSTDMHAGIICGWDGKRKSNISSDTLIGSIFGEGNAIIIASMATVLVAAGVVIIVVYKKRKQNADLTAE